MTPQKRLLIGDGTRLSPFSPSPDFSLPESLRRGRFAIGSMICVFFNQPML
ncbi:hypothetical protein ACMYSP_06580 [Klebsiella sp. R390]|uniref:hypothetical protein n=1 Tax=Klebsiella sp. R390 TaxID=2755400 RepID=UPI003DA9D407